MFLDHRTIGSHLYRIVPKLGNHLAGRSLREGSPAATLIISRMTHDSDRMSRVTIRCWTRDEGCQKMSESPNIVAGHGAGADGSSWSACCRAPFRRRGTPSSPRSFLRPSMADDPSHGLRQVLEPQSGPTIVGRTLLRRADMTALGTTTPNVGACVHRLPLAWTRDDRSRSVGDGPPTPARAT